MKYVLQLTGLFLVAAPVFAQLPFTQFVVFGDSLSDNGNIYYGTSLLGDPTPAPPLYATGEFTDGTNSVPSTTSPLGLWIEQLAPKLNLPVPQPYYAKAGLNYAVGGAETGSNPSYKPGSLTAIPWATDQLNAFLSGHPTPPSDYMYVFWCGANDILANVSPTTAVANVQGNIATLAKAGAKYFFWANMPPMGEVPEEITTSNRAAMDAASVAYNTAWVNAITQLYAEFPGIMIAIYDVYDAFEYLTEFPSEYGFVNVTSPAQGLSVNPNTYLFWDVLHPTTAGHAQIASAAYDSIETLFNQLPVATSVVNAFGFSPTIAPNTWVAVKGYSLSSPTDSRMWLPSDFVNNQMPTSLDGVSVSFNGTPGYIYYISPTQINVLTPPNLPVSSAVQVQVKANSQSSPTGYVQTAALSPSFFVFDGTHVVATHLNYTDVGPTTLYPGLTTPAQPGEEVVLYANGFGTTSSPVVAGAETQSGTLPTMPVVTIGPNTANVVFAGLVSPGLYQFNVYIPQGTPSGDNALTATYNGLTTQTGVVITVQ